MYYDHACVCVCVCVCVCIYVCTASAHQKNCPHQQVECEYKHFNCDVVLQMKEYADLQHQTSVQAHLQLTKRIVEEQAVRLQEQEMLYTCWNCV